MRRRDTVEKCLVFVLELREVSNLNDKSLYDFQPSLNVVKWMTMQTQTHMYLLYMTCSIKTILNTEKDFVTHAFQNCYTC